MTAMTAMTEATTTIGIQSVAKTGLLARIIAP